MLSGWVHRDLCISRTVLLTHPRVRDVAVIGVVSGDGDDRLDKPRVFVVLTPETGGPSDMMLEKTG